MDKMIVQHIVKPHEVFVKWQGKLYPHPSGNKQVGRIGTFVGINVEGIIKCGWSVVAFHAGDTFNAHAGIAFATLKAVVPEDIPDKVEKKYGLRKDFQIFKKRCSKFFKGMTVENYDPSLDVDDEQEENVKQNGEEALREALRNVLPHNSKHLADGPILGFGDGMKIPIDLGHAEADILKMINSVSELIGKEMNKKVNKKKTSVA